MIIDFDKMMEELSLSSRTVDKIYEEVKDFDTALFLTTAAMLIEQYCNNNELSVVDIFEKMLIAAMDIHHEEVEGQA